MFVVTEFTQVRSHSSAQSVTSRSLTRSSVRFTSVTTPVNDLRMYAASATTSFTCAAVSSNTCGYTLANVRIYARTAESRLRNRAAIKYIYDCTPVYVHMSVRTVERVTCRVNDLRLTSGHIQVFVTYG